MSVFNIVQIVCSNLCDSQVSVHSQHCGRDSVERPQCVRCKVSVVFDSYKTLSEVFNWLLSIAVIL